MAKNLKINIKNTQIAQAINLSGVKKAVKKKEGETPNGDIPKGETRQEEALAPKTAPQATKQAKPGPQDSVQEDPAPLKVKARSKSQFAEPHLAEPAHEEVTEVQEIEAQKEVMQTEEPADNPSVQQEQEITFSTPPRLEDEKKPEIKPETPLAPAAEVKKKAKFEPVKAHPRPPTRSLLTPKENAFLKDLPVREKLGPTGRHVKDLVPPKPVRPEPPKRPAETARPRADGQPEAKPPGSTETDTAPAETKAKGAKFKEYRDLKPAKQKEGMRQFDSRDKQGLREGDDDQKWRKRKLKTSYKAEEDIVSRPTSIKVRLPIAIKDLAAEMKLKASQLIAKLFLQGLIVTLNDFLDDETTIQLLGHEFGCEIAIDKTEEDRIRITDKTIQQEIAEAPPEERKIRPPVVAFMGHVDHGKTSLIDAIRKSNRVAGEAGAITQHIGAFMCHTAVGDIAILDTPGHEAFSAMRARGAHVTDIVVLVVAGDEGIRQQTIEAIQHAKAAGVIIVVAINKADKPNFNPETVYRQLSEQELLPEAWGGQTITVNCSAVTGEGIPQLLEMLALQAEVLEIKAHPTARARGTVIESEMHKGLGSKATVLVQNGTLKKGDSLVFEQYWGRIKTMHNEFGQELEEAGPSHPVEITGLSGLPEAGQEFIVVKSEKEAKEISDARTLGIRQTNLLQKKKMSMENILSQASETGKKILNIVLRADVQGSLEAIKVALQKIESDKAELNIIFAGVGEISESDVQLAGASKAVIMGFHTQIESHADQLVRELGIVVKLHDIIYHAIDEVKLLMKGLLDKIAVETEKGKALVKATFKSSQLGQIAGCQVTEGVINRNNLIRVKRGNDMVFKGTIASLKKVKEDVREVAKGFECGILINNFNDAKENDIIEAYEITYLTQEI